MTLRLRTRPATEAQGRGRARSVHRAVKATGPELSVGTLAGAPGTKIVTGSLPVGQGHTCQAMAIPMSDTQGGQGHDAKNQNPTAWESESHRTPPVPCVCIHRVLRGP